MDILTDVSSTDIDHASIAEYIVIDLYCWPKKKRPSIHLNLIL